MNWGTNKLLWFLMLNLQQKNLTLNLKKNTFKILSLTLGTYWLLSCLLLIDVINGQGDVFPFWLDIVLLPGYFLGFALGFFGGNFWALIGQLITLAFLLLIIRILHNATYKKRE